MSRLDDRVTREHLAALKRVFDGMQLEEQDPPDPEWDAFCDWADEMAEQDS